MNTPTHNTKAWAEVRKKQKEGTCEPKFVKVASEVGLASISTQLWIFLFDAAGQKQRKPEEVNYSNSYDKNIDISLKTW